METKLIIVNDYQDVLIPDGFTKAPFFEEREETDFIGRKVRLIAEADPNGWAQFGRTLLGLLACFPTLGFAAVFSSVQKLFHWDREAKVYGIVVTTSFVRKEMAPFLESIKKDETMEIVDHSNEHVFTLEIKDSGAGLGACVYSSQDSEVDSTQKTLVIDNIGISNKHDFKVFNYFILLAAGLSYYRGFEGRVERTVTSEQGIRMLKAGFLFAQPFVCRRENTKEAEKINEYVKKEYEWIVVKDQAEKAKLQEELDNLEKEIDGFLKKSTKKHARNKALKSGIKEEDLNFSNLMKYGLCENVNATFKENKHFHGHFGGRMYLSEEKRKEYAPIPVVSV